jgi:hypothetical protein
MEIKIRYSAIDGFCASRTFKTIRGARQYAHRAIGETPELGSSYAVSGDGMGKIEIGAGTTWAELFPALFPARRAAAFAGYRSYEEMQGDTGMDYEDERPAGTPGQEFRRRAEARVRGGGGQIYDHTTNRWMSREETVEWLERAREAAALMDGETYTRKPAGCTCTNLQLIHVGCDCAASRELVDEVPF